MGGGAGMMSLEEEADDTYSTKGSSSSPSTGFGEIDEYAGSK